MHTLTLKVSAHEVDGMLRSAAATPSVLSLAGGLPAAETFPRHAIAEAAREAIFLEAGEPLQYGWPEGRLELRARIARRLEARGAVVDPEDIHITSGAQDGLTLAIEVLGADRVQVDGCTYPAALDVFRARGCTPVLERAPVRYAMPAISNPQGQRMDGPGREGCLEAEHLIEDDAYGELDFEPATALPPLVGRAPERVFHLGTLSKTVAPGLRIGWLVAPPAFRDRLRDAKGRSDLYTAGLTQAIAERLLAAGDVFDARLDELRTYYRRRAERLAALLEPHRELAFTPPRGGFSIWVATPRRQSDEAMLEQAIAGGVAFDPGSRFMVRPPEQLHLRLSYSALPDVHFAEAVERLVRALG